MLLSLLRISIPVLLSFHVWAAECIRPSVRREWRTLSHRQRAEWIGAVKCLAHLPHDNRLAPLPTEDCGVAVNTSATYYDDVSYMHINLTRRLHWTGLFFPWHRWFLHVFETALRTRCGFKGALPYWDWTIDAHDIYNSPMFSDCNPQSGFGGWGDPFNDFTVTSGAFSSSSSFRLAYPVPHALRRNFTLQPWLGSPPGAYPQDLQANVSLTRKEVMTMVHGFRGDFKGFQAYVEGFAGSHSMVHSIVGGDLAGTCPRGSPPDCQRGPFWTPNDPLFWLHHAMIDRIWYEWQRRHACNELAFLGGSVQPDLKDESEFRMYPNGVPPNLHMDSVMPAVGMFPEATIGDVMDTQGGYLCYVYR